MHFILKHRRYMCMHVIFLFSCLDITCTSLCRRLNIKYTCVCLLQVYFRVWILYAHVDVWYMFILVFELCMYLSNNSLVISGLCRLLLSIWWSTSIPHWYHSTVMLFLQQGIWGRVEHYVTGPNPKMVARILSLVYFVQNAIARPVGLWQTFRYELYVFSGQ